MKKIGRPKEIDRPIRKEIRLTHAMAKRWDPDAIRDFLSRGKSKKISTKRLGKDDLIPLIQLYLTKSKEKIPIEAIRAIELFFRAIKDR